MSEFIVCKLYLSIAVKKYMQEKTQDQSTHANESYRL